MGAFEQAKEEIRSRADIVSVVGRRVSLKRKGAHWSGRCPFHDDHDPSMNVNPVLGIYKCFVCGAGGDVFKFVMEHDHIGFREAIEILAVETGVRLPERTAQDPEEASRAAAARSAMDWAQAYYHRALLDSPQVLGYARRRGLEDGEIGDFHLGFAPDGDVLLSQAPAAGHSLQSLESAGLVTKTDSGRWRDRFHLRLVFPLTDLSRRVIGFAGRNLRSDRKDVPKYLNSPETEFYRKSQFLYGLGHSRSEIGRLGEAVVVEGYMDWHALWRHGIRNVVAASGTAFTREQARLLSRHCRRVVCFFDGDRAGIAAAERSLPILLMENIEVRVADLEGTGTKDPDELLKASGPQALKQRIAEAHHWVHFLVGGFRKQSPRPTPDQRADFLRRVKVLLEAIADPVLRDQCAQEAHPFLEVMGERHALVTPLRRAPGNPPLQNPSGKAILVGSQEAEAKFLQIVLTDPVLVLDARNKVEPSDLSEPRCRSIWDLLVAESEWGGVPPDARTFVSRLDPPLADFVAKLFQFLPEEDPRKWMDDFLRDLQLRRLRERRRILASEARLAGGDPGTLLSECSELMAQEQQLLPSRMET
jgi:DNA primase